MPFDETLAARVRAHFDAEPGISEKRMFGGAAFLVHGNLCVCVTRDELLVRVGVDGEALALDRPGVRPCDIKGRPMRGWVFVAGKELQAATVLTDWVTRGLSFARTLPVK